MKIGFIGAGKVGCSLGKYFCEHNLDVIGYYSKNPESAIHAAEFTDTMYFKDIESIIEASDTLFLTVPDGAIKDVWDYIQNLSFKNKIICHCSGSLSSAVFSKIDIHQSYGYSIHPLFAISDKLNSYKNLSGAFFTLEGSKECLQKMQTLIRSLGNTVQVISSENKHLYHSAAVFVSNFMVALTQIGIDLMVKCGFDENDALLSLKPLIVENIQNIVKQGTVESLTGPVERYDLETITNHLNSLSEKERQLYILLSEELLSIAKKKNPDRNYDELKIMLGE
ncbi:DUF2520 domain-containing protein [Tissierella creatinini]|nr:DUF2520 domain-containing protein [Tissierella creatinini]TJX59737.1 DUF2520 domain-containing protein [Soehngenia saccharolytica]